MPSNHSDPDRSWNVFNVTALSKCMDYVIPMGYSSPASTKVVRVRLFHSLALARTTITTIITATTL